MLDVNEAEMVLEAIFNYKTETEKKLEEMEAKILAKYEESGVHFKAVRELLDYLLEGTGNEGEDNE